MHVGENFHPGRESEDPKDPKIRENKLSKTNSSSLNPPFLSSESFKTLRRMMEYLLRIEYFFLDKFQEKLFLTPGPGLLPGDRFKGVGTALKTAEALKHNATLKFEDRRNFSGFFIFCSKIVHHMLCTLACPSWVSKKFLEGTSVSLCLDFFQTLLSWPSPGPFWTRRFFNKAFSHCFASLFPLEKFF